MLFLYATLILCSEIEKTCNTIGLIRSKSPFTENEKFWFEKPIVSESQHKQLGGYTKPSSTAKS